MKNIEDIEKMSLEELEALSDESSVEIPEGFDERLKGMILAAEALKEDAAEPSRTNRRWFFAPVAAAIAAIAVGLNLYDTYKTPEDTCSTPEEAYAQVEQAFMMIGGKMDRSRAVTSAAMEKMNRSTEIINRIRQ